MPRRVGIMKFSYTRYHHGFGEQPKRNMYSNENDHFRPLEARRQNSFGFCSDISPSSSHFFEVLYVGKVRVSHRKVNEPFLDAALLKFKQNELQRSLSNNYHCLRRPSQGAEIKFTENGFENQKNSSSTVNLTDYGNVADNAENKPFIKPQIGRNRANSIAIVPNTNKENSDNNSNIIDQNRTMLFHVGRSDLRLISPDRKQTLLYKQLKDVVSCVQSKDEPNYFGVTCRDPSTNNSQNSYLSYVFKCESDSVVSEIISAVKQSHAVDGQKAKSVVMSCGHCPSVWFQRLLIDIEGLKDQQMQDVIMMRINELPEDEQKVIFNKLNTTASLNIMEDNCAEQVQLMLTILRAHCDSKQSRHVHDTAENRHEFLNHYLGGGTIFMKAKKSLTNSFDQLLKRKPSRDSFGLYKEHSLPLPSSRRMSTKESSLQSSTSSLVDGVEEFKRPRSPVTVSVVHKDSAEDIFASPDSPSKGSPKMMKEIFLKVGSSPRSAQLSDTEQDDNDRETGSWRQNILKNVITPKKHAHNEDQRDRVRDTKEFRALWKKAINQQILLIRMEKENAKLYARQEEATTKRIKLEYDDICSSAKENTEVWEQIMNKGDRKYDDQMLLQAIKKGIPRGKRGEVWIFLAEQFCARMPPPIDTFKFPKYNLPYEQLLKELTSQQHAILIDLGRTFPNHSYFMSPLGAGQLALFNLLKAYSLLDEEVAYCQGLSFIAGVLLLHMSESEAFRMLRHLMFRRNLRQQYLPDMAGLQIQLYQLTRLLKDYLPELYEHFDKHEISPILYAAPWILTIFASQFPLGFVVRIFDLIFIEGSGIIFKTILALLTHHKDCLLACDGFEQIMDYLKITVPLIEEPIMDYVVKMVCTTDITKALMEYSVEYHVLQEELATPRPETKKLKQMEEVNSALKEKNQLLMEQLEIALTNNSRLETVRVKHLSQINKLESEVRSLEVTVATLGNFISTLAYGKTEIEIPNDVLRILSQLNIAERRRSLPKSSLSDLASDNESVKEQSITLGQARSLTPKSASSYFAKSFDQIRQQKLGVLSNDVVTNRHLQEIQLTKSLSDTRNLKFDRIIEESSADRSQSLGRVLNPHEMETLKQFQKNYRKIELEPESPPKRPAPLKASKSNFELKAPVNVTITNDENSLYPLNCGGVQISYRGTRTLKSLSSRPVRTKSEMQIQVPQNINELNNLNNKTGNVNGHESKDENCNKSVDSAFDESVESFENVEDGER